MTFNQPRRFLPGCNRLRRLPWPPIGILQDQKRHQRLTASTQQHLPIDERGSSTAPFSRRSSINKMQDPKDPKTRQYQVLRHLPKSRIQTCCRERWRRRSISAPATPLHKTTTPSSSPLPGFAQTPPFLQTDPHHLLLHLIHPTLAQTLLKSSMKTTTTSSVAPTSTSSAFNSRTGSLRVPTTTTRSKDLLNPSSSPLRSASRASGHLSPGFSMTH
ncbi:FH2 domain-containing protein 1-like protein [Lates japonicus]|uniref:FH2 domain-containing protein 1-like protein n=1 Tax=Lates japonicus TaxID=270547 RepID=A0AAD3NJN3_LATJO|nr:FH2 domain-containing protein 1-like protein [Lates japonicus]